MTSENILSLVSPLEIHMMLRGFIPAVIIVIIGIIVGKWDASKHQLTLTKLLNYIFLPCLAFTALHKHPFDPIEILSIAFAVLIITCATSLFSVIILRDSFFGCSRNVLATVYMSSGTLLPPLAFVLFGNAGLAKAIYFHLFIVIAYNSLGVWMASGKSDLKSFFKMPLLYCVILGIAAGAFPFSMSETIEEFVWLSEKGIYLTAMGALPLLLISFGYPLGLLKRSDAKGGLTGGLLKVVAGPMVALLVIYTFRKTGLTSMERGYDVLQYLDHRTTEALIVLGASMPTSISAMQIVGDEVTAEKKAMGTLLSSAVCSVITVPAVLLVILMFIFTD